MNDVKNIKEIGNTKQYYYNRTVNIQNKMLSPSNEFTLADNEHCKILFTEIFNTLEGIQATCNYCSNIGLEATQKYIQQVQANFKTINYTLNQLDSMLKEFSSIPQDPDIKI